MGTNYYRIPSEDEVKLRHKKLLDDIRDLDLSPKSIERGFESDSNDFALISNDWSEFLKGIKVHLGKRSGGWQFLWDFNDNEYYSNREELFSFIRSGRVIDEYSDELNVEDFIEMALNWEPNGKYICEDYYRKEFDEKGISRPFYSTTPYDKEIDGLRVSSYTGFC